MTSDRGARGGRGGRGDGARCSTVGCVNKAQSNGKCRTHTGVGQCTREGCEKQAQYKGLCVAHGGRRVCTHPGCNKTVTSKGKCGDHGGGRRRPSRSKGDVDAKPVTIQDNANAGKGSSMMSLLLNEWPKEVPGLEAPSVSSAGQAAGWIGYNDGSNKVSYPAPGYPIQAGYSNYVVPVAPNPVQQSNGSMMSLLVNGWAQQGATNQVVEVKVERQQVIQDNVQGTESDPTKEESTAGQTRNPRKRAMCSRAGCEKFAQSQGLCVSHGGKRCVHPDCTKSAQLHGLCITHGGSRSCSFPDCTKTSRSAGRCFEHGGGSSARNLGAANRCSLKVSAARIVKQEVEAISWRV